MTTDSVVGPALSFSGLPVETGSLKVTTHLLYSDTNAKGFVSERSGSTTSSQRTYRLIPVIQFDRKFANSLLKSGFFYDLAFVHYEDAASPGDNQFKKVHQFGNESAYLFGNTRLGFGARSVRYERTSALDVGNYPSEQILNVQASHAFRRNTSERSSILFEPTLGGYAVTRNGFYPTASAGVRHETQFETSKLGEFLRVGFTRRFPSLLDRYYQIRFQVPGPGGPLLLGYANPGLKPENVRSLETGLDFTHGKYRGQLTFFARDYKNARYTRQFTVQPFPTIIGYQVVNAGDAYVVGTTESHDWQMNPLIDLGVRFTYQRSMIKDLKASFPYSPKYVGILKADFHDADNRHGLEAAYKLASDYVAYSETSGGPSQLPGYTYLDLFARAEVYKGVQVIAGVENVFNRRIQFRITAPDEGRIYSLAANATW
jgi:outer membrane receptor protein involved in Fe transport